MTAVGPLVYSSTGMATVCPPALFGTGAPLSNLRGILGQNYFDISVSPRIGYVWDGQAWQLDVGPGTFASFTVAGPVSINDTGAAATSIGSLGTGTVAIGNATSGVAAAGDLTVANGNVIINSAGKQLRVHGGAVTDFIGAATLVAGTVTIANTNIAATDRIQITRNALNASPALGFLIYTINAGTSFTVTSYSAAGAAATTDVSGFVYVITRQV